ncbi:MAG: hypothetical protein WB420_10165 [Bradyrhizobium sp.]
MLLGMRDQFRRKQSPAGGLSIELTLLSGVKIMHTYEKPQGSRRRGPNYAGLIALTCLFVSMFATWAVMRTNLVVTASPTVTLAQSGKAQ